MRHLGLLVVLAVMLSASLLAQAPTAQMSAQLVGSVLDATGLALAGVTVTLRGASDQVTHTDSTGHFEFQNLPGGEYELTTALQGFAPVRQTLRLTSGQTLDDLTHARAPDSGADRRDGVEGGRGGCPGHSAGGERADRDRAGPDAGSHGRGPRRTRPWHDVFTEHRTRAGHDPRDRHQCRLRGVRSEFRGVSRWRLPRAAGDGARGLSRARASRGPSRPSGDALRPEQPRRCRQPDHEVAHQRTRRLDPSWWREPRHVSRRRSRERPHRSRTADGQCGRSRETSRPGWSATSITRIIHLAERT